MILFEKVRWKNFLSTGNQYSEIDFQGSPTTLIVGANGSCLLYTSDAADE